MVVFDSSILLLALDPKASPPNDPATGQPLDRAAERIKYLIARITSDKERIVIPTPVLSEVLVHAGEAMQPYLDTMNDQTVFRLAPFDQKAAIETALAMRDAIKRGGHRIDAANPDVTKAKIKLDRQIIAIAKVKAYIRF